MTYDALYAKGQKRANELYAQLPIEQVQEAARSLSEDMRSEANEVFEWTLNFLEYQMSESDFIEFCNTLM